MKAQFEGIVWCIVCISLELYACYQSCQPNQNIYKNILKSDGIVHLKTDSEFLHGYTLGLLEGFSITPLMSNHNVYSNLNAPDEVLNIKTHYEKLFSELDKNISYLSFNFNDD